MIENIIVITELYQEIVGPFKKVSLISYEILDYQDLLI